MARVLVTYGEHLNEPLSYLIGEELSQKVEKGELNAIVYRRKIRYPSFEPIIILKTRKRITSKALEERCSENEKVTEKTEVVKISESMCDPRILWTWLAYFESLFLKSRVKPDMHFDLHDGSLRTKIIRTIETPYDGEKIFEAHEEVSNLCKLDFRYHADYITDQITVEVIHDWRTNKKQNFNEIQDQIFEIVDVCSKTRKINCKEWYGKLQN